MPDLAPGRVYRLPNGDHVIARYACSIPASGQHVDPEDYLDPRDARGNWVFEPIDGGNKGRGVYIITCSEEGNEDLLFIGPHTRVRPIQPGSPINVICDAHTPTAIRLDDLAPDS